MKYPNSAKNTGKEVNFCTGHPVSENKKKKKLDIVKEKILGSESFTLVSQVLILNCRDILTQQNLNQDKVK